MQTEGPFTVSVPKSYSKILPIVGAYFRPPAALLLSALPINTKLILEPDPHNQFDASGDATKVMWDPLEDEFWVTNQHTLEVLADGGWDPAKILEYYTGKVELPVHIGFIPNNPKTGGTLATDYIAPGLRSGEIDPIGKLGYTMDGKPGIMVTITPRSTTP